MKFSISFSNPWLLFLLIPVAALILVPYFLSNKKYRRTRNRICAMVCHSLAMVLLVFTVSGMQFNVSSANEQNEIIILVDVSDTEEQAAERRDEFVYNLIEQGRYNNFNMGVVTFGFTQNYAVPLTDDLSDMYERYKSAELPDVSATDIAAALTYTKELFTNPSTGKIVLVTDGKETDEAASSVISSVAAQGTAVDIAYIPSEYSGKEIQLTGVTLPDYHVNVNESCEITLTATSEATAKVTFYMYDNGVVSENVQTVEVNSGKTNVVFTHTFTVDGLHELSFTAEVADGAVDDEGNPVDNITVNNTYNSYIYLEVFNKVLVLESQTGQSEQLSALLTEEGYDVTVVNADDAASVPDEVDELREYDQVILNNIANSDLPEGFDEILYSYVYDYGGGLFTCGGSDENGDAHAYSRSDLYGTTLQEMLPVQATKYTPPLGLIVIIDRSGSMSTGDGEVTKLDQARSGAVYCLEALSERDYMGVLTLDTDYNTIIELTPKTQQSKIRAAINEVSEANGGTSYKGAIEKACRMLRALEDVEKRHIIVISDGQISGTEYEECASLLRGYYESDRITFSMIGIGVSEGSDYAKYIEGLTEAGGGNAYMGTDSISSQIRNDLTSKEIKEVNFDESTSIYPIISDKTSPVVNGLATVESGEYVGRLNAVLKGYYGVKKKDDADVILSSDYGVPLYAQWKFGNGMVGSFMCDLDGTWSSSFLESDTGKQFIIKAIFNLMPTESIRASDIRASLSGENYIGKLSVYSTLAEGDEIMGEITYTVEENGASVIKSVSLNDVGGTDECYVTTALSASNGYSRCVFAATESGIYQITLTKHYANGETATYTLYKELSYSTEYDKAAAATADELKETLSALAEKGDGTLLEGDGLDSPWTVFDGFILSHTKTYDPRMAFLIAAIVIFLLDIAVRKFKFKWIHEIIRDRNDKKSKR